MTGLSFNPRAHLHERALQAWLILIATAHERRTILYGDLAYRMFNSRALRQIGKILGHIAYYCEDHGYPHLNCIAVNTSGRPGWGIPRDSDLMREEVFGFSWYHIVPPSPEALKVAYDARAAGQV